MSAFLCVRAGGLGDVILLRPATATLRAAGYDVWLLAPKRNASALLGPAGVQGVLDWDGVDVAALLSDSEPCPSPLVTRLRLCTGAIVYSESDALVRAIRRIIPRTTHHPPLPPDGVHAGAWCTQPVFAFASPAVTPEPFKATPEEERDAAGYVGALPRRFLAIHAGSGSPLKNWPVGSFSATVEHVAGGEPWLLVEGPAETATPCRLRTLKGARIVRDLPPRLLGAILAQAGVYVGNDSGVTHLAAAWNAPTVALFGPTDPRQWAPLGENVCVIRAPQGDLLALTAGEVAAAALRIRRS
jgi:ADP-heptose:LPS heptosyltransferase